MPSSGSVKFVAKEGLDDNPAANPNLVNIPGAINPDENEMQVDGTGDAGNLTESSIDALAKKHLAKQTQEVVIPSYSAWFSFEAINEIEKKAFPEFFSGKNRAKTPTIYREYRDFMMNAYRLNPSEYLTVTACRRNLAGDVCAIIRVHAFLEQWGLINYQVDPSSRPSVVAPPYTGHFKITADTPKGLVPMLPNAVSASLDIERKETAVAELGQPGSKHVLTEAQSLALRKNVYAPQDPKSISSAARFVCASCGVDCSQVRYHNTKSKDVDLCSPCYLEGRFLSTMSTSEFVKVVMPQVMKSDDVRWSEDELLLLLEGIEMYDDDWSKIAEHVGTRTREQCILQFLQLPIDDKFLEQDPATLGPLQFQNIPFSQADNPVMSVVAFLASVVNPGVASAAAKAALKQLGVDVADDNTSSNMETDHKETGGFNVQKAAAAALGAAAVKAKALSDHEDREIQRLVNAAIETQIRKMELKMTNFEELEAILENERKEIERQRQQLYLERVALQKVILESGASGARFVDQHQFSEITSSSHSGEKSLTSL